MVHPETRALDKGICLAQQMCHIMILFQNGSSIKDEINQNVTFFVMFWTISFSCELTASKVKYCLGVYVFQDPPSL